MQGWIVSGLGPAANCFAGGLGPASTVTSGLDGVASTRTRRIRVNPWGQGPLELVGTKNGGQGQVQLIGGSVQTQICVKNRFKRTQANIRVVKALIRLTRLGFEPWVEALICLTHPGFELLTCR